MQNVDNVLRSSNLLRDFLNGLTLFALNDNSLTLNTSLNGLMLNGLMLNTTNGLGLLVDKVVKVVKVVGGGAYLISSPLLCVCYICLVSLFTGLYLLLAHLLHSLCQYRDALTLSHVVAWCTSGSLHVVNVTATCLLPTTYLLPALMTHPHPRNFTDLPYIHPTLTQTTFSTSIRDCLKVQHTTYRIYVQEVEDE